MKKLAVLVSSAVVGITAMTAQAAVKPIDTCAFKPSKAAKTLVLKNVAAHNRAMNVRRPACGGHGGLHFALYTFHYPYVRSECHYYDGTVFVFWSTNPGCPG
jgi:hypothetical protein